MPERWRCFLRVDKARLSMRNVRMKNCAMLEKIYEPDEINRFFSDWQAYGLTRLEEWFSRETTHKALLRGMWRGTDFYSH